MQPHSCKYSNIANTLPAPISIALPPTTLSPRTSSPELIPPISILALEVALLTVLQALTAVNRTALAAAGVRVTAVLEGELVEVVAWQGVLAGTRRGGNVVMRSKMRSRMGDIPMFPISEKQYMPPFWHLSYCAVVLEAVEASWGSGSAGVSVGAARFVGERTARARYAIADGRCMVSRRVLSRLRSG